MADKQHARSPEDSQLLVLGSDNALRARVSALVRPFVPCTTAPTLEDALSGPSSTRWFGLVLVLGPTNDDVRALETLRPLSDETPCAVCLPDPSAMPNDDASTLAEYVLLAHSAPDALFAFVHRAIARVPEHTQRVCAIARYRVAVTMSREHGLTMREREVLVLSLEGLAQGEVGARLRVSARTLEKHVSNLLWKTGADRLHQLVVRCLLRAQELVAQAIW